MTDWHPSDLDRIGTAEELRISSHRADGSLRPGIPIWHVAVDGALYVRSAYGPGNGWFRRARQTGTGRVEAGGAGADVAFERLADDDPRHAALDAAFAEKYARFPSYVAPLLTEEARTATLRVMPAA
ncbi:DUF2255 family protein [Microbacterium sp. NPDC055683]